ncbi:MAG TPA: glycosyltransferase [Terriglobales bacterium]|nr:glycosyltransferase [Terriglobales bacterium]
MKLVIFGLTISSSWGNGHATLWRGLCRALAAKGHAVTFFERDVPYYANHRDLRDTAGYELVLYPEWSEVRARAKQAVANADCAIVTSYCVDARAATELILDFASLVHVYYDLDTPVTLERLRSEGEVEYLPECGLSAFDLVLSYTGGEALDELKSQLGARRVAALYGSVDANFYRPSSPSPTYAADLSYLGTYAADRQAALERLFVEPARRSPDKRFLIGGAMYPGDFPWTWNIYFVRHVPPPEHPAFYSSSPLTLSVTRSAMANMGYCPSGRLFEAAACETAIMSDYWRGLEAFFEPGREILIASTPEDVSEVLKFSPQALRSVGAAARKRVLSEHTADHRCNQLLNLIEARA